MGNTKANAPLAVAVWGSLQRSSFIQIIQLKFHQEIPEKLAERTLKEPFSNICVSLWSFGITLFMTVAKSISLVY